MVRKLDIAMVTWRPEGIERIAALGLPRVEGVTYVISWQAPGENPAIPPLLASRDDVEVHLFHGRGVAANRNNACRHCRAPLVLMGDDDLIYRPEGLRALIYAFDANPAVDAAMCRHEGGTPPPYPATECDLTRHMPKGLYATTFDIAVRREVLAHVSFDERFGPGAPRWEAAEDEVFWLDLRRAGFRCRFFPVTLCTHPHPTTGERPMTPGVAAAAGRVTRMQHPISWPLRLLLRARRERRKGTPLLFSLRHLFAGAISHGGAPRNPQRENSNDSLTKRSWDAKQ